MSRLSYSEAFQDAESARKYDEVFYSPGSADDLSWRVQKILLDRILRRYCPWHRSADALDFACGTGRISEFMMPRVKSLVGVDISQAMISRAKERVPDSDFICTDIVRVPEEVPGDKDIVTCFRFLPRAEPSLRVGCIKALATKLRSRDSVMILGSHQNPCSRLAIKCLLKGQCVREGPKFSLKDMHGLAAECGLRVVGATGHGFIPHHPFGRLLSGRPVLLLERILAGKPLIWRFGINLIMICRRK